MDFGLQFFPKTEKYISLFMGNEDQEVVTKRSELRERIRANLLAAAAAGLDLEGQHSHRIYYFLWD